jgi:hypothetical protein
MWPFFKILRCSNEFNTSKSVFLAINASFRWLNPNLCGSFPGAKKDGPLLKMAMLEEEV